MQEVKVECQKLKQSLTHYIHSRMGVLWGATDVDTILWGVWCLVVVIVVRNERWIEQIRSDVSRAQSRRFYEIEQDPVEIIALRKCG